MNKKVLYILIILDLFAGLNRVSYAQEFSPIKNTTVFVSGSLLFEQLRVESLIFDKSRFHFTISSGYEFDIDYQSFWIDDNISIPLINTFLFCIDKQWTQFVFFEIDSKFFLLYTENEFSVERILEHENILFFNTGYRYYFKNEPNFVVGLAFCPVLYDIGYGFDMPLFDSKGFYPIQWISLQIGYNFKF